jgi:hypothetical protein
MSGPLGVSHMVIFNQTDAGINMRVARCPRGPTCTFRVNKFALMNDVLRSQKRPRAPGGEFGTPPLVSGRQKQERTRRCFRHSMTDYFDHAPRRYSSFSTTSEVRLVISSYWSQSSKISFPPSKSRLCISLKPDESCSSHTMPRQRQLNGGTTSSQYVL